jgi:hypothetical protein
VTVDPIIDTAGLAREICDYLAEGWEMPYDARRLLAAAVPLLASRTATNGDARSTAITFALETVKTGPASRLGRELVRVVNAMHDAGLLHAAPPDTDTAALRAEVEAERLRADQLGETANRLRQERSDARAERDSMVRDLLAAVYPGDPMPDRPLDTVWEHLLEQVRKTRVRLDQVNEAIATGALRGGR